MTMLLALSLFALIGHANNDPPNYTRDYWTINDGLPTPGTTAITQDQQGYLWLGSLSGLSRFDGNRFVNFYPSNTPLLPSAWITALQADLQGRVWIGTRRGLIFYQHGRFQRAPTPPGTDAPTEIRVLALDGQARLLIGSSVGVHRLEPDGMIHLVAAIGPVDAVAATPDSTWAGEGETLYQLQPHASRTSTLPHVGGQRLNSLANVAGTLWASTSTALYQLDGERWLQHSDPRLTGTVTIRNLSVATDGSLWVAEPSRLLRVVNGELADEITLTPEFPHAAHALHDRDGNLWLTSTSSGVMRLWPGVARHYPLQGNPASPLVWTTLALADGRIVAGGMRGLSILRNHQLEPLLTEEPVPHVYTLMAEDDSLWLGTFDGVMQYRQGQLQHPAAFAALRGIRVNGLLRDHARTLWLTTNEGLYRQRGDGPLQRVPLPAGFKEGPLRVMLLRKRGALLVGGESGLFRVDEDQLIPIGVPANDPAVNALHELPGGQLIVATGSYQGLHLLIDRRWHSIDDHQGLPSHHTPYAVTDDGQGNILVSGFMGVYRVAEDDLLQAAADSSIKAHAQMLLTQNNRLQPGQLGHCCNGGGLARGFVRDGSFWVPASDGVYQVDINAQHPLIHTPTAVIEQVRVNGRWRPFETNSWVLSKTERDLVFDFNVLGFDPLHSLRLRYRLLGYDRQWHTPIYHNERSTQYTNLPSGGYTFQVQALDENDTPLSSAELTLHITPYFHETWLFRALVVLAMLIVAALLARGVSYWHARRQIALEKLIEQRTGELRTVNRRLDSISRTDPLTGLYNRRHVVQQIPLELARVQSRRRSDVNPLISVLALVDIDHFKVINDTWGHDAGDEVLREISRRLAAQMRSSDYVTRWGGEEFLVVFHNLPVGQREIVAERLRDSVQAQPVLIDGHPHGVTVSIGLVEFPVFPAAPDALNWQQALWLADMAMYAAKRAGRNGWAVYQPADSRLQPPIGTTPQGMIDDGLLALTHSAPH